MVTLVEVVVDTLLVMLMVETVVVEELLSEFQVLTPQEILLELSLQRQEDLTLITLSHLQEQ